MNKYNGKWGRRIQCLPLPVRKAIAFIVLSILSLFTFIGQCCVEIKWVAIEEWDEYKAMIKNIRNTKE